MSNMTYPNQKMIKIHREAIKSDFLGIKNENWQAAARDLRPYALAVYLYLASNADNYTLALSAVAVQEAIGISRSTYNDQVQKLIDKGYLVQSHGNTYDFYEVPHPQDIIKKKNTSLVNNSDEDCTRAVNDVTDAVINYTADNREINNSENVINNEITNINFPFLAEAPKVKEIVIKVPEAEGKSRPSVKEKKPSSFEF